MMRLRVAEKHEIAEGIFHFVFERDDGTDLPICTPGSHLVIQTPAGLERRYSLCNSPADRKRYSVAVKYEPSGAGGSRSMVDDVVEGNYLEIEGPENYFKLDETATSSILIAGGIGITPILAMAKHLSSEKKPFQLIYCSRSLGVTAFLDEINASEYGINTIFHHDGGDPSRSFNFNEFLQEMPEGRHIYCCGPRAMMQAVRASTKDWPTHRVHFEDFGTSKFTGESAERTFWVKLAKSGLVTEVPPGVSIIDALRKEGVEVPSSCESGTCGTCRTKLLDGIADHRDFVLDEDEQADNIMICVSRAKTSQITIEL
jgi:phthalate 4,5-dioxygenase reductase component